ncbi:UNVERIFIED_CONTAM: Sorting nexin 1 [Sesamum angustifolium]|uniref:Sorting nexin 1 n=1 Tax=Sesamum angustifolium TaxID=2727405 RepID=A0AAW2N888_9LAMI
MRRQALDVFVNRIALHHELQQSEDLRTFLQADEQTMERARSQETGIFLKKPADLMQIFKGVQSKVSDVVLGKEKPAEESDPEYEKLKNYIFQLEDHLAEAQKHAHRLVKRHRELGQSLSDFGKAVKLLGNCEESPLGNAFSELGTKSEILSTKLQREAHHLLMNFEEPLKDYIRAVQSIKATIAERANAFRQNCELAEAIKFKEIDMNKLRITRSEKLGEAQHEYEELKADGAEATRRFEKIVKLMNEEIIRFQEQKTLDMGLAFHEFAKGQADLANGDKGGHMVDTYYSENSIHIHILSQISTTHNMLSTHPNNTPLRLANKEAMASMAIRQVLNVVHASHVKFSSSPFIKPKSPTFIANNNIAHFLSLAEFSSKRNPVPASKASSSADNITPVDNYEEGVSLVGNSLCQGANLPLPVPLKVDKIPGGARLGFITVGDGETEVLVYIDCLVFPATDTSVPMFRAIRNGPMKDQPPPGEPRIMRSLLDALKKCVEIARI